MQLNGLSRNDTSKNDTSLYRRFSENSLELPVLIKLQELFKNLLFFTFTFIICSSVRDKGKYTMRCLLSKNLNAVQI